MRRVMIWTLLVVAGCSGAGSIEQDVVAVEVSADLVGEGVSGQEDTLVLPEVATKDLVTDVGLDIPDFSALDLAPACGPGEGCFGDQCTGNDQCQSGWCVEHLGEGVCSEACQEECPDGWSCQQVAGTEPDVVYICVSDYANLCKPCGSSPECQSTGAEDVCVDYGDEGAFCGGGCNQGDCPWGFSCKSVQTVDGVELKQCVADAGVCPCTDKSVELGLWTPCSWENEFGLCAGKRVCTEQGLAACDASVAAPEECNGEDEDCDGEVDEPTLVDGKYVELCDDENQCTADACSGPDGCVNTPLDEGECTDGNPCTVADHCLAGECIGDAVECNDENPCTDNVCTATGGCEYPAVDGPCDDEDPCTLADTCLAGACQGTDIPCDCMVDADCQELEDGDLCNGTLACDTNQLPHKCAVDLETVVECPEPDGTDSPCLRAHCEAADGNCSIVPGNEGGLCDDDDACTVESTCLEGLCQGGLSLNCNDGNPCTDDWCDNAAGCQYVENLSPCSDEDVCTVSDACSNGQCVPGAPLQCDDGNNCNGVETCDSQVGCLPGQSVDCDDDNPCTVDSCDGDTGLCVNQQKSCPDDGDVCTTVACDENSGECVTTLNQALCNDGDLCTFNDHCHLGECIGGTPLTCDDGNVCTDDSCQPGVGCQFSPNQVQCDDGNQCTTDDVCSNGWCGGAPVQCNDGNLCTDDFCNPVAGCEVDFNLLPCNDDDPCTLNDACAGGVCQGTGEDQCDDENPCTLDVCVEGSGCQSQPLDEGGCDDGDPCTLLDQCQTGQCGGTGTDDCNDNDVCTSDSCVPFVGCVYGANDGNPCDDEDECTLVDVCQQGECTGSGMKACDDGNPCTNDMCVSPTGCEYQPAIPCCGDGQVDAPESCDDGNTLSGDGCDKQCQEEQFVSMQWTDPSTGSCNGQIWQTMQNIVDAMPAGPITVKIEAEQVQPTPNYGYWSATFESTTCVRQWIQAIANKDVSNFNTWNPAVCQATSTAGESFFFVCKNDGGGGRQIVVYPVGAQDGQYMKIYIIDRTGPWCDLIGTNARPGADNVHNNSNTSGVAGDYLKFTWYF